MVDFHLILPLIAFVLGIILALVTLLRDHRSLVHQTFALFLICGGLWDFTIFGMRASPDIEHALAWEKAVMVAISLTSVFLYRFSLAYSNRRISQITLTAIYLFPILVVILSPMGLVVSSMQLKPYGWAPVPGPLFPIVVLSFYFFGALTLINLVKAYKKFTYEERNRTTYIIAGLGFPLIGGIADVLPLFGIAFYPGTIIGNTIFAILATIAVLKHNLLDIQIVLRKGIAYSIISAMIAIPYVGTIFLFTNVFHNQTISLWLYLLLIVVLAIMLQPLWSRVQSVVDKWFYRERYDHLKALEQFTRETMDTTNLGYLADSLIRVVSQAMQTANSCLMLRDSQGKRFTAISSYGLTNEPRFTFQFNSALIHRLSQHESFLEKRELDTSPQLQAITMKERDIVKQLRAEILIPLKTTRGLTGILILGPKLSKETYSEDDQRLLTVVSQQVSITLDNARLYEESRQAYKELETAQERVISSERLKALGEMTSGIAHDFNNALTIILGRAQLSLAEAKKGEMDSGKITQDIELIEQATLDAAQMVRRLQDFARVRTDHALDVTGANEIIQSALEMIKPRLDEQCETFGSNIKVIHNLGKISLIEGNAGELRESLVNILINAIHAMSDGGKLTIKSKQDDDSIVISISDTGIGMTDEVRKKVFEPFFTTKGAQGLGMGLSVVYGTISRHKGQISVSSEPGKGTTFTIRLPITQRDKEDEAAELIQSSNKKATILVIDDNEGSREVLYEILTEGGHNVDIAASGKEGLSLAKQREYDIVVTDLGMPGMSGQDVAVAIKIDRPAIQVILVTGWGIQLDPTELKEQGLDSIIAKPFSKQDILAAVSRLLDDKDSVT